MNDKRQLERAGFGAALSELAGQALKGESAASLLDLGVRLVAETLNTPYAAIFESVSGGSALLLRSGVGWKDGLVGTLTVAAAPESLPGRALVNQSPVMVANLAANSQDTNIPLFETHQVAAGLTVAIPGPVKPFGVLGAFSTTPRRFTLIETEFSRSIAIIFAQAIAAERSACQKDRYFRSILENAPNIIAVVEANGTMRYLNAAVRRISGFNPDELVGKSAFEFFHPQDVQTTLEVMRGALQEPNVVHEAEFRVQDKNDGAWHLLETCGRWFLDENEQPRLIVEARERGKLRSQ